MDTGVRDLKIACFKANSTWINDIGSKNLSKRPIYAVLNTHNLDMILQLKNMPIDLYHAMLKQKILHGKPLIQCEARRAKTKLFVLLGHKMAAVW